VLTTARWRSVHQGELDPKMRNGRGPPERAASLTGACARFLAFTWMFFWEFPGNCLRTVYFDCKDTVLRRRHL